MPEVLGLVAELSGSLNRASKDAVDFVGEDQQCPLGTWVLLFTMFFCVRSHDRAFLWFCCV